MTSIYLVRHAEAEGNLYRRIQGQYNSNLTSLGRRQAQAVAKRFEDIPVDAVYASDLYRAMETAAGIARSHNLPLHVDKRFREVSLGIWEDLPFEEVNVTYRELWQEYQWEPTKWRLPKAETCAEVEKRVISALQEIAEKYTGRAVVICLHGFALRTLLCSLFYGLDNPLDAGFCPNTGVCHLLYQNGNFRLDFRHDSSHLQGDLAPIRQFQMDTDMTFRPVEDADIETYIRWRKDAWELIYGDLRGFSGPGFWLDAQRTRGSDRAAMAFGCENGKPAGIIQLSPDRDKSKGVGYIPFIYLAAPWRYQGLGNQLIGYAVSYYRNLGRSSLQLSVAPDNASAIAFYKHLGFENISKDKGAHGRLLRMALDIRVPEKPADTKLQFE